MHLINQLSVKIDYVAQTDSACGTGGASTGANANQKAFGRPFVSLDPPCSHPSPTYRRARL